MSRNLSKTELDWMEALNAYFRQDYAAALSLLTPLAESGYAEAQNFLANMYYDGDGVVQDYELAEKWFRAAAKNGLPVARASLEDMERAGLCTPRLPIQLVR